MVNLPSMNSTPVARRFGASCRVHPDVICISLIQLSRIHCTFTDKSLCHKCYALSNLVLMGIDRGTLSGQENGGVFMEIPQAKAG